MLALAPWRGAHVLTASLVAAVVAGRTGRFRTLSPDKIDMCIAKLVTSDTGGVAELDQTNPEGVRIETLAPSVTGFPAWSRREDHVETDADLDRGHADWAVPEGSTNRSPRILYCHGGGYEYFSPQDVYRPVTTRLAKESAMPVLAFDYRKVPEFRHPAQLEDAVQAFKWIAKNGPEGPGEASAIFLAGDSAGGGLVLALALYLRDNPIPGAQVAGVVVVSPETDLSCSGESYTTRRWKDGTRHQRDPIFRDEDPTAASLPQIHLLLGAPGEEGSLPYTHPALSVLYAELHSLPPTLIHVGDAEVMLSDSTAFQEKASRSGSPVEVKVWPRMWHCFNQYSEGCGGGEVGGPLEEAVQANREQGEFLRGLAAKLGLPGV